MSKRRTRFVLGLLLLIVCSIRPSFSRKLERTRDDEQMGGVVSQCICTWPVKPTSPDNLPECASKPMMCAFCARYVELRYKYDLTSGCDYFDEFLRPACIKLAEGLEAKSTSLLTNYETYVSEMGWGGGASNRLCFDAGCCKYK